MWIRERGQNGVVVLGKKKYNELLKWEKVGEGKTNERESRGKRGCS